MSYDRQLAASPAIDYLLGAYFFPSFDARLIDPGQALDNAVRHTYRDGRLIDIERELSRLLRLSPDEASATENLMPWLSQTGLPDGNSYRGFLRAALSRVRQALADPTSIPDPGEKGDGLRPARASRFHDLQTANAVATEILRAHEQQLRAWTEEPGGWWRQHYYLPDMGRSTGVVMRHGGDGSQEVSGAVVIMNRDHETGQPFVFTAYPEVMLATDARTRFPDLTHLFGGYFGQDCFDEGGPLPCQHNFQATTTDPARARVADQLDALLRLDGDHLRDCVDALGSYVLPASLRSWLLRMRWRMDAFDWSQAADPA